MGPVRAVCCVVALAWPAAAWSAWLLDADAGLLHDSNLPRAKLSTDIQSGWAATGGLSGGYAHALDGYTGVTATADARIARYDGHSGLDLDALGATLGIRHKFGLGLNVPWAGASFSAVRENYGTGIRDSDRYSLTLETGYRFSDRFDAVLGGTVEKRNARNSAATVPGIPGDPFELYGRTLYARGSYALTERWDLAFGFGVRSGDVVASTRRNFQIFTASSAIARDPAFGPDYFAYRLYGVTRTPWAGVNWALTEYSTLRVVYTRDLTYGANGFNYYNTIVSAAFLHRF
jgi:hypothetical protein